MSLLLGLAAVLLVVGALIGEPGLIALGLLVAAVWLVRAISSRRGLHGLEYRRELGTRHAIVGDEIPLTIRVWNRSLLPIAWLTADDHLTEGAVIRERSLVRSERSGQRSLRNGWSLAPYERVVRHLHIGADQRGTYTFGPVRLEVADLFAAGVERQELDMPDHYVVSPRSVPVRAADPRARWRVQERPVRGFPEDPALFAGVRPYAPGDPLRSLHWKATARTGQPRSKRFDASREREVMLVLDIQSIPGPYWQTDYDDDLVESLCMVTASLARDTIGSGGTCGFAAAAFTQSLQLEVRILPGGGTRQLLRIDETLARLSSFAAAPFEVLLGRLPRWVPQQTELVTISARDPLPYVATMRRLRAMGYPVRHVAIGPDAAREVAALGRARIPAQVGHLQPDWRSADALELAS